MGKYVDPKYNTDINKVKGQGQTRVTYLPAHNIQIELKFVEGGEGMTVRLCIPSNALIPFNSRVQELWATEIISHKLKILASIMEEIEKMPAIYKGKKL